ncbi:MAG: arsenic resistance protein [Nitrosopumilus sp.]|nr:arsenic resistance protein [Nitrosopumilus sp.]
MVNENSNNNTFYLLSIVILLSMAGGIMFPSIAIIFEPYLLIWLGLLLFFNLIRLDAIDLLPVFTSPKYLIILTIVKLTVIPLVLYFIVMYVVYPKPSTDTILAIFLLSGISTGLGSPFVANFVGSKLPIIVGLIIATSLAVPFILPGMVYLLFKSQFSIPILDMVLLLSGALFVPLAISHIMKKYAYATTQMLDKKSLIFSIVFIFLMNFGVFAKYSYYFFFDITFVLENVLIAFLLFGVYGFMGYTFARFMGLDKQERISVFIAMTWVNNMLVVVFAQQFFNPQIAALSAFFNVPYYVGILILKMTVARQISNQ